jgi:hypothetical protein
VVFQTTSGDTRVVRGGRFVQGAVPQGRRLLLLNSSEP